MSADRDRWGEGDRPGQPPLLPVGQLPPQPWMTSPKTSAVMTALTCNGAEARFIGGCVRDAVLNRTVHDVDIATPEPPEAVIALLRQARIKAVPTGIAHGTITAIMEGSPFEITTLRLDVETDGRRARVAFTDDWVADAARRDFTVNALSCDKDGAIYDYFHGLDDLGQGRIRFVGDAQARITEDRLRLLRFFRFYAHYGRPPPDPDALAACREHAAALKDLSGERVRVEMLKTLLAPDPAGVVGLMRDQGVLRHLLPEARGGARDLGGLRMLSWLETRALCEPSVAPAPLRRLASVVLAAGSPGVEAVADRLKLSNEERRRLFTMMSGTFPKPAPALNERALRRMLYEMGVEATRDRLLLAWADDLAENAPLPPARTEAWIASLRLIDGWIPISFPLKGRDALKLGLPAGPRVGKLLAAVESWWQAEDFRPDREACLGKLRALASPPSQDD